MFQYISCIDNLPSSRINMRSFLNNSMLPKILTITILVKITMTSAFSTASVPIKVFCYGDSLTAGTSPPLYENHPYGPFLEKALQSYPGYESAMVRWSGLPGWTANVLASEKNGPNGLVGILNKISQQTGSSASLAIILAGTNDLAYETESTNIVRSIVELHSAAHDVGVPTIALTIPPSAWQAHSDEARTLAEKVNDGLKDWVNKMENEVLTIPGNGKMISKKMVTFVDFPITNFNRDDGYWAPDGLHFSPQGYQFIGESLAPCVKSRLEE